MILVLGKHISDMYDSFNSKNRIYLSKQTRIKILHKSNLICISMFLNEITYTL